MFIEQIEINTSHVVTSVSVSWALNPLGSLRCIGEMKHNGSKYARLRDCGMPH